MLPLLLRIGLRSKSSFFITTYYFFFHAFHLLLWSGPTTGELQLF